MKYTIVVTAFLFLLACKDEPSSQVNKTTGDSDTSVANRSKAAASQSCYSNYKNRDTVILNLSIQDSAVTGELLYSYYQKDRNKGTIGGIIKGDTVIADYSFKSEGTTSLRQVVFLKRGDKMVEGFGDVVEENGKMVFTNRSALVFDSSLVLAATDCSSLPAFR